ncbi:hypothetical protein ACFQE1_03195 [Halobium palmae]|uniref:Uncharacterized protein n=1 Tax=Halobium palmae TaxID=1776492 RepID=A0ABD5RVG0_9EURY
MSEENDPEEILRRMETLIDEAPSTIPTKSLDPDDDPIARDFAETVKRGAASNDE